MRAILILILCFLVNFSFSQVNKQPIFSLGIAHRNYVIRLEDKLAYTLPGGYSFNSIEHFRVTSLSIDIARNIWNRHWHLQLSNYVRYGHVVFEKNRQGIVTNEIKRIKYDHLLDMLYKFDAIKKRPTFVIGGGLGLMNCNTAFDFDYNTGIKDGAGNWIFRQMKGSFRFFAPRLVLGIERKNKVNKMNSLNGYFIIHGTPDEDFDPLASIWLEFKGSYSFQFKKRKT